MTTAKATQATADATPQLETLAAIYKAGGDPLRLNILRVLRRDTFGVLELSQIFAMRQSGMSHHLKVLARAGLLESQREGNAIFYRRPLLRVQHSPVEDAIAALFTAVDRMSLPAHLQQRLDEVRTQRAEQSRVFFARNAERFREQQELIAALEQYAAPAAELIARRFPVSGEGDALEIGPGEGGFLETLASRFNTVTAVDSAPAMLEKAGQTTVERALDNVTLVEGEAADLLQRQPTPQFDLVVAHMVLHHVGSPPDIFSDSAKLLKPGGRMVVSDLCRHEQRWVRDNCGDLWQGFEPEELTGWARAAGLVPGETLFIGLRNGFQIQVREFEHNSKGTHTS